ncbi:10984_t:CDS:2, partial [Cetraspora pellucida]
DDKKKEENEKEFQDDLDKKTPSSPDTPSKDNFDEDKKNEYIKDIEFELKKKKVSEPKLNERLGDAYTCANCGVEKEEYTVHEVGGKKFCSYECKKAFKGENKSNNNSYGNNFGFSSVSEFFAWMKKLGVNEIRFDVDNNQVIISCNGNKKLKVSEAGLSTRQQEALTERFEQDSSPITFSQVSDEINKNKNKNGNGGIIAAIVVVGVILALKVEKIECIKKAGQAVSNILKRLKKEIRPGISGQDLDKLAQKLMKEQGVQSSSLGYKGFSASICVAINHELTHGIPDERVFQEGDLVSIDVACHYQGYHADAALTTIVGTGDETKKNLLNTTKNSLYYVIQNIQPGLTTTQDIGAMIEKYIRTRGYYPIKEYGGHGIGEKLHQEPFIPNYKTPSKGEIIKEGMFICIEPLVQIGDAKVEVAANKWTVFSKNGHLNAHFEHTVYIGPTGEVIELINKKKFRVACGNGKIIEADMPARFRTKQGRRRAAIVVGDKVKVEIILGDLSKGQIISLVEEDAGDKK